MSQTMVPVSGRIESDLYDWFIALQYRDARTNSDKLREALKELRLQREALDDPVRAGMWVQRLLEPLREALARIEHDERNHSEVLSTLLEHLSALTAMVLSARPRDAVQAAALEDQLVRRTLALNEALLRQALTPSASAFDSQVVRRHCTRIVEVAALITPTLPGESHG